MRTALVIFAVTGFFACDQLSRGDGFDKQFFKVFSTAFLASILTALCMLNAP